MLAMDPKAEPPRGRSARLINQIIAGTHTGDHFQIHGAIVATLELYSIPDATHLVFRPALAQLAHTPPRAVYAGAAVNAHIATYPDG
jgi:hypothetical protein